MSLHFSAPVDLVFFLQLFSSECSFLQVQRHHFSTCCAWLFDFMSIFVCGRRSLDLGCHVGGPFSIFPAQKLLETEKIVPANMKAQLYWHVKNGCRNIAQIYEAWTPWAQQTKMLWNKPQQAKTMLWNRSQQMTPKWVPQSEFVSRIAAPRTPLVVQLPFWRWKCFNIYAIIFFKT